MKLQDHSAWGKLPPGRALAGAATQSRSHMKRLMILVLLATVTVARADDSKISPELRAAKPGQKVQVIVQYAPGTQLNCSGLLGIVDCLLNDIVKLGGTSLGPLTLVNVLVALLVGSGLQSL